MEYLLSGAGETKPTLILITPPPVDSVARKSGCVFRSSSLTFTEDRVNEVTETYAKAVVELAQENNLKYIDLFSTMLKQEDWKNFFYDGLHFSAEGNKFLWQELKKVITELGPLTFDFPHWSELSHHNPEETFANFFK